MGPPSSPVNPSQAAAILAIPANGPFARAEVMPSISIARTHALSHQKARDAAERVAQDLKQRFQLDYAWDGDDVMFERPGVTGRMRVGRKTVELDVKLGFALALVKPVIEREIHTQLDRLFGKPKKA
jgi:putative polyhydroxyalkanoate system protein